MGYLVARTVQRSGQTYTGVQETMEALGVVGGSRDHDEREFAANFDDTR